MDHFKNIEKFKNFNIKNCNCDGCEHDDENMPSPESQLPFSHQFTMPLSPHQIMEQSAALAADKVFLVGEINDEVATCVCRQMMLINEKNAFLESYDPIHFVINSPGGDMHAGWMICDVMDTIEAPIITYGFGCIASAGLLVFMNGDYGYRFATKNTQFMSHRFSMISGGNHSDLVSQQPELGRMHKRIIDHYTKCTGLQKKDVEEKLLTEHNVWFTAAQAKKMNILDKIIHVRKRHFMDYEKEKKRENGRKQTNKRRPRKKSSK